VNERRTVVGGLIGHCVSPPTVERDRRAWVRPQINCLCFTDQEVTVKVKVATIGLGRICKTFEPREGLADFDKLTLVILTLVEAVWFSRSWDNSQRQCHRVMKY